VSKNQEVEIEFPALAEVSVCEGCCCGVTGKGNAEVPTHWLKAEWEHRNLSQGVELSIRYCLGRCKQANIVAITSPAGTQWLSSLKTHRHYRLLVDWAEKSKRSDLLVPLPKELRAKVSSDYDQPIAGPAEKKT
jgi:cobaltochelatase CobN